MENIPQKTNFTIVANHTSYMDSLIIMAVVPKKIHCIAFRGLYKISFLRWFLRRVEAFPSGQSSEEAVELLTKNKNIGLFPEGGISRDGTLREFRRGTALLAIKTARPLVPCAILGAHEALPRKAKFPKFVPIKVKIGEPVYLLKDFEEEVDDIHMQEGIFKVRNKIKEMLDAG